LLESSVEKATGRDSIVDGVVEPKIGLGLSLKTGKARLQNAEWGSRSDMFVINGLEIRFRLCRPANTISGNPRVGSLMAF
jgi:hypothetical protein